MSDTNTLTQRLESMDSGADFTDHNTYMELLYPESDGAPSEQQADTVAVVAEAPAAAAPPPATESSAPAAPAEEAKGDGIAGVVTRDGKNYLPFAVLEGTRAKARELSTTVESLSATVEQLKADLAAKEAGTSTAESDAKAQAAALEFSDEELADMEDSLPAMAKLARAYKSLQTQVAQAPAAVAQAPSPAAPQEVDTGSVQALIDQRPLLARWQAVGGAIWKDAVARDVALSQDPAWSAKTNVERFAEVERQIADELGIPLPTATPNPPPAAAPAPKSPAIARTPTPTLSDFNGTPSAVGDPMTDMAPGQMVDAARNMSVEELRRMVGIAY